MRKITVLLGLLIMGIILSNSAPVSACSEIYIDKDHKISARTFDFPWGDGVAVITPRGTAQKSSSLSWTTKYGNVIFKVKLPANRLKMTLPPETKYILCDVDGINERGLKIGLYFLAASEYPEPDQRQTIEISSLIQYYLDNFQTVDEAVSSAAADKFRVLEIPTDSGPLKLHMYLHDASGDGAILEYLGGKPVIHRNPPIHVLTNSKYEESLATLGKYEDFGGKERVPGSSDSLDRFVRGAYNLKHLTPAASADEAVAYGFDTIGTVASCPGDDWPSYWTIVTDINNKKVFVRTASDPDTSYLDLNKLDFSDGKPVLYLDMTQKDLSGDISSRFAGK